jgi:hypothetical protein
VQEQLRACYRHCCSVAAALSCETRSSLIAATIFHNDECAPGEPAAAFLELHAASQATPRESAWVAITAAEAHACDVLDDDPHGAAAGAPARDSYLRTRPLAQCLKPLCLAVHVPALPKGSTVEVQPVCAVPPAGRLPRRQSSSEGGALQRMRVLASLTLSSTSRGTIAALLVAAGSTQPSVEGSERSAASPVQKH